MAAESQLMAVDEELEVFAKKAAVLRTAVVGRNATYRKAAFFFGSLATLALPSRTPIS